MTKGGTELGRRLFSLTPPGSQHSRGARDLETLTTLAWTLGSNRGWSSSGEASPGGFMDKPGDLAKPREGEGRPGQVPHGHCSWLTSSWASCMVFPRTLRNSWNRGQETLILISALLWTYSGAWDKSSSLSRSVFCHLGNEGLGFHLKDLSQVLFSTS